MESFFLDIGFSWTMSKIMPYLLMLLCGVLLCLLVRKFSKRRWVRIGSFILIVVPVLAYIPFNPIYQGDFSNDYRTVEFKDNYIDLEYERFTVLAIPYCEFCEASLLEVEQIMARVDKEVEVDFIVCTANIEDLEFYTKNAPKGVNVKIVKNMKGMIDLAKARFPAFLYAEKGGGIHVWSNDQFGVKAKDWIETKLNK